MKKTPLLFLFTFLYLFFFTLSPAYADAYYEGFLYPYKGSSYMMVPARSVFQSMGAQVQWFADTQKVEIKKDPLIIQLQINNTQALVNGEIRQMPVPAIIKEGFTFLPLRFLAELIGKEGVRWEASTQTAVIPFNNSSIYVKAVNYYGNPAANNNAEIQSFSTKIKNVQITGIKIPYNSAYKPAVVLANNQLGTTQNLYDMAKSYNASAAINGTFFSAYSGKPVPWNTIIKGGKIVHAGDVGTVFGFTADRKVKMEQLKIYIKGATDGSYEWPHNWYAYGFNHVPGEDTIYIFTPEWGTSLGFSQGINIAVANGIVKDIKEKQDMIIPPNGYVINFTGSCENLAKIFEIGQAVEYRVVYYDKSGREVSWSDVVEAVSAGPTLVKNGEIKADPAGEGFTEPKILSLAMARSAIGVTLQGDILLVTAPSATIQQLAQVMKELGAYNAMNLDGGASSGLYLNGKYLTRPGRELSNALIFYK